MTRMMIYHLRNNLIVLKASILFKTASIHNKFHKRKHIVYIYVKVMRVRLIKKQTIEDFIIGNAQSKASFEVWLSILKRIDWLSPKDIVTTFNSADILGNASERVVFNIGGNKYRMICKYHFGSKSIHLFIKWIGTHAEYTKLCRMKKQYDVNSY